MKLLNTIKNMHQQLNRLTETTYEIEGEKLYPVEVDIIALFDSKPDIGVTEISKVLGVTKGAVSQKIDILCKKGILGFEGKVGRKKHYCLSPKGMKVALMHQKLSLETIEAFTKLFESFKPEDLAAFENIGNAINKLLSRLDYEQRIKELAENESE